MVDLSRMSNVELLEVIAAESVAAKQLLREAGFGATGMPLLATVKEAIAELNRLRQAEDFPLGNACDLSGETGCEACQ